MFVGTFGEGGKIEEREDVLELGRKGKMFVGWSTFFSMEYSLLMTYHQL